jgi:hypothetical protein
MPIRQATVKSLAEGAINALTNINGGSTHLNVRDWMFWSGKLTPDELAELYQQILDGMVEVYAKNGVPVEQFKEMLPK